MTEWVVSDEDLGCDGAYFSYKEIVRCKDCEYYYADEKWCRRLGLCGAFNEDDFCSHGERREDDE